MKISNKPPHKRRKTYTDNGTSSPTTADLSRVLATTIIGNRPTTTAHSCVSCNRVLNVRGTVLQCAICLYATCAICSRTCTQTVVSNHPTIPSTAHLTTQAKKPSSILNGRRKHLDEDNVNGALDDSTIGCGRVLCRTCCYEDTHSNTIRCRDCSR